MVSLLIPARLRARQASDAGAAMGIVPFLILIAGFSLVAILLVVWLDMAMENKAADAAACVEETPALSLTSSTCGDRHSETRSFTTDSGYTQRY